MKFTKPPLFIAQQIDLLRSRGMRIDDVSRVARYLIDESVLRSFMHHLTHIRNLTAHHCRLWNRRLIFTLTIPMRPADLTRMFNPDANRNIYNTLAMLGYLLKVISPGTTWPVRIRKLVEEYVPDNTEPMGFPKEWRNLKLWKEES